MKSVPIRDQDRFCTLLSLAATASSCDGVWLDALSINQDSDEDKKALIACMGDIFKHAVAVLVLLPEVDQQLFGCLTELKEGVLRQDEMGLMSTETATDKTFNSSHTAIIDVFISTFEKYKGGLVQSVYFERAWTFQEWALARDLDVTCENTQSDMGYLKLVSRVKSSVIRAGVRLAVHRGLLGHYRAVKFKIANADLAAFVDDIKSCFPQEDIFCSSEEINWGE
jgi:hypothetical protein